MELRWNYKINKIFKLNTCILDTIIICCLVWLAARLSYHTSSWKRMTRVKNNMLENAFWKLRERIISRWMKQWLHRSSLVKIFPYFSLSLMEVRVDVLNSKEWNKKKTSCGDPWKLPHLSGPPRFLKKIRISCFENKALMDLSPLKLPLSPSNRSAGNYWNGTHMR